MWVRILEWFGSRFGMPLGAFWGAFGAPWDHLGTVWGPFGLPLGPLGDCWVSFLALFTAFRCLWSKVVPGPPKRSLWEPFLVLFQRI